MAQCGKRHRLSGRRSLDGTRHRPLSGSDPVSRGTCPDRDFGFGIGTRRVVSASPSITPHGGGLRSSVVHRWEHLGVRLVSSRPPPERNCDFPLYGRRGIRHPGVGAFSPVPVLKIWGRFLAPGLDGARSGGTLVCLAFLIGFPKPGVDTTGSIRLTLMGSALLYPRPDRIFSLRRRVSHLHCQSET